MEFKKEKKNVSLHIVAVIILLIFFMLMTSILFPIETSAIESDNEGTYIKQEYVDYCFEIGNQYGIAPTLLIAIIEHESSGKQYATNGDCKGLCQIHSRTWADKMYQMQIGDIYDPHDNILLCAEIISEYREQEYGEDVAWVLMKYNGFSKADEFLEQGRISYYAESVLERSHELETYYYGNGRK